MRILVLIIITAIPFLLVAQSPNKGTFKVRKAKEQKEVANSIEEKAISTEMFYALDVKPSFPGGETALLQFLDDNIKLPKKVKNDTAFTKEIVYIRFVIDKSGNITDIKSATKGKRLFVNEAIRVIKLMPKWTPGKIKRKKIFVPYTLPVIFKQQ